MTLRISALATIFCGTLFAADPASATASPERALVIKEAKKKQVRHSMIGMRDTLLFYTFVAQKAVLVLHIDNANTTMEVSGSVHLFDPKTSEEALGKWLNNQHSDGLFADAPEPAATFNLPDGTGTVTERKLVGREKQPTGDEMFDDYQVQLSIKEHRVDGKFRLAAFADEARVFVKSGGT
jgi:hypothetical protein